MLLQRLRRKALRESARIVQAWQLNCGHTGVADEPAAQKALLLHYRDLARQGANRLPPFAETGFRKYSQFEEDGILLYLFALIQPRSRICVELGSGSGRVANTTNLILNHGWWGFLFDGDESSIRAGREFFGACPDTMLYPPRLTHAWITAENVNDLLKQAGASGEIDLLSIDVDGMDYWIWKAIDAIQPRVVVCEIQNPIPPDLAVTVPYQSRFVSDHPDYRGASLLAMTSLARAKGYRLVGSNRYGFNIFFVRNELAPDLLPEATVESCALNPYTIEAQKMRWPAVRDREWVKV